MSSKSINNTPRRNPVTAGTHAKFPISEDSSIAGISNDHTEAATITPEAKPKSVLCALCELRSFRKSTTLAPISVPKNGNTSSGRISIIVIIYTLYNRKYTAFFSKKEHKTILSEEILCQTKNRVCSIVAYVRNSVIDGRCKSYRKKEVYKKTILSEEILCQTKNRVRSIVAYVRNSVIDERCKSYRSKSFF